MGILVKSSVCFLLIGCAGAPKITPHVLDTQLMELREYKVIDAKNLTIQFVQSHPMTASQNTYGNGFWCIPADQAKTWQQWCLKNKCVK